MDFLKELRYFFMEMRRDSVGFLMAEVTCRYHAPARFDDLTAVKISTGEMGNRSFTLEYQVTREEKGGTPSHLPQGAGFHRPGRKREARATEVKVFAGAVSQGVPIKSKRLNPFGPDSCSRIQPALTDWWQ